MSHCQACADFQRENARLRALIDTPEIVDFVEAVKREAAHQRERWGESHDQDKSPEDWFWTLGYLAGKALGAFKANDMPKALHHLVSSSALLSNQHRLWRQS